MTSPTNLVQNGDFAQGVSFWAQAGATSWSAATGQLVMELPGQDATPDWYDVLLAQNIPVTKGHYVLYFTAKASKPVAIAAVNVVPQTVNLTTSMETYVVNYDVPADEPASQLHFTFGLSSATPWTFTMDDVQLYRSPATFTATVVPGDPIPHVELGVLIDNPSTVYAWQIWRDSPGQSVLIYTSTGAVAAITVEDITAPLGVPVTYRLVLTFTDGSTFTLPAGPVTITGTTGCYLTDPATSKTIRINLVRWPIRTRAGRGALLDVLNRPDPVGLIDAHRTPAGTWTLYTATDAAGDELDGVLDSVGPIVLRTQPTSSIKSVTVLVGDYAEVRYSGQGGDQRRTWTVSVQEVAQLPAGAFPLPATLNGLDRYVSGTLLDLAALRPTLFQISQIPVGT
jgi:hypothetical protein